ncbi:hypothetical protein WT12_28895 [Burkholderia territorii]|nr:hypothetical protein WT12_28895 [Burkholderia territorii]
MPQMCGMRVCCGWLMAIRGVREILQHTSRRKTEGSILRDDETRDNIAISVCAVPRLSQLPIARPCREHTDQSFHTTDAKFGLAQSGLKRNSMLGIQRRDELFRRFACGSVSSLKIQYAMT